MVYGSWCEVCKTDWDVGSDNCDVCNFTRHHAQPQHSPVSSSSHVMCGVCTTKCSFYSVYCGWCNTWKHEKCENLSLDHVRVLKDLPVGLKYLCKRCCGHPFDFKFGLHRVHTALMFDRLLPVVQLEKILLRDVKPLSDRDSRVYFNYKIDQAAEQILNSFIKNSKLIPVEVEEDGNCVFRSGSFCVFGHQGCAAELRLRTVIELVEFFAFYILEPRNKHLNLISPHFLDIIRACCTNGQPSSSLIIHAVATVVSRRIQLIYPFNPWTDIKYYCLLNRQFEPRIPTEAEPIYLMCSLGSQSSSHQWNHVVPLLSNELLSRQRSPQHSNMLELSENAPYSTVNTLGLNSLYQRFENLKIEDETQPDDRLFVSPNIGPLKVGASGSDPLSVTRTLRQIPCNSSSPFTPVLLPPQKQSRKPIEMKQIRNCMARKNPYSLCKGGSQGGRIQRPGASKRGTSQLFKNKKQCYKFLHQIPQDLVCQVKISTVI